MAARFRDTPTLEAMVDVRFSAWRDAIPRAAALCRKAAVAAFRAAPVGCDHAEVSIVLADDDLLRTLNRDWRTIDSATNVLAFPCESPGQGHPGPTLLGDVVIAWQTTQAEAARDGVAVVDHLQHLVVHGMLHLLGFDHDTDEEGDRMEALETRILGALGVADPHAAGSAGRVTP